MRTIGISRYKLRKEDWGGLALDQERDRVWGLDEPAFTAARDSDAPMDQATGGHDPFLLNGAAVLGAVPSARHFTLSAPISVSWVVTRRCQSACIYCCTDSHIRAPVGGDLTTAKRAIEALARWGALRLIIGGGEPLLRSDIAVIAAHAANHGLSPALATNGFLLDDGLAAVLSPHVMQFQISLDAVRPADYARLRGAAGGPHLALRAISAAAGTGRVVRVVTVLSLQNIDRLEEIAAAVDASPATQWFLFAMQPSGRGARVNHKIGLSDPAGARVKLVELRRTMRPGLAVCFWGEEPADTTAVYLDEDARIVVKNYKANSSNVIVNANADDMTTACQRAWEMVPTDLKYATFQNFTSPARGIHSLANP